MLDLTPFSIPATHGDFPSTKALFQCFSKQTHPGTQVLPPTSTASFHWSCSAWLADSRAGCQQAQPNTVPVPSLCFTLIHSQSPKIRGLCLLFPNHLLPGSRHKQSNSANITFRVTGIIKLAECQTVAVKSTWIPCGGTARTKQSHCSIQGHSQRLLIFFYFKVTVFHSQLLVTLPGKEEIGINVLLSSPWFILLMEEEPQWFGLN